MPSVTRIALAALLVCGWTAACSNSNGGTDKTDDAGRTGADESGRPRPTTSTPPEDCRRLSVEALSTHAGRKVELNLSRSGEATKDGTRGFRCVLSEPGRPEETGSIVFTVYGSASEAKAAYDAGLSGSASLGIPVVKQARGDAAYAVNLGTAWSCSILAKAVISTASLASDAAEPACNWAEEARTTFG